MPDISPRPMSVTDLMAELIRQVGITDPEAGGGQQLAVQTAQSLIKLARKVLLLARPEQSFRSFLLEVLRRLPLGPAQERERQRLLGLLHVHRPKAFLDASCSEWTTALLLLDLLLMPPRTAPSTTAETAPARRRTRGPVGECRFRWKKVNYAFSRRRWRLLKSLWEQDAVAEEDVMRVVYGREELGGSKLRQLELQTNRQLRKKELPFTIVRPGAHRLKLKTNRHRT
jgi:hypothetical protein